MAKLFLNDEDLTTEARAAFAAHGDKQIRLVAPFAIHYEFPQTLLSAVRRSRINADDAGLALEAFLGLDIPIIGGDAASIGSLTRDAYDSAFRLGCSFYDAIFLALAERLDTQVLTADNKLYERLGTSTQRLLWLGDLDLL